MTVTVATVLVVVKVVFRVKVEIFVDVDVHIVYDSVRRVLVSETIVLTLRTSVDVQLESVVMVNSINVRVTLSV